MANRVNSSHVFHWSRHFQNDSESSFFLKQIKDIYINNYDAQEKIGERKESPQFSIEYVHTYRVREAVEMRQNFSEVFRKL